MKKIRANKLIKFTAIVFVFTIIFSVVAETNLVGAAYRELGRGYFTNEKFKSGRRVIKRSNDSGDDGIPGWVSEKEELVKFITMLHYGWYYHGPNSREYATSNDMVGADFIIQTMRGKVVLLGNGTYTYDYGRPDDSDVIDWQNKVRDPNVGYSNSELYYFEINTKTVPYGTSETNGNKVVRDVVQYQESANLASIVFYVNSVKMYAIKRNCGNPVGELPGLPPPPPPPSTNFILTPDISVNPDAIEQGSPYTIIARVWNTGNASSSEVNWSLNRDVSQSGIPDKNYSGKFTVPSGNNAKYIPNNPKYTPDSDTDYDAGTKICWTLTVSPKSNTSSSSVSDEACVVIGKKPKVQVWGSNLKVGGLVKTSTSVKTDRMFGSWAEYAIFAGGTVSGMASGSMFAGTSDDPGMPSSLGVCNYSALSFTNANDSSCVDDGSVIGNYTNYPAVDISASFRTSNKNPRFQDGWSLTGRQGLFRTTGDVTITGGQIGRGQWVVVNAGNHTVNITGDIRYDNVLYRNIYEIPQVIIIARNIVIHHDVGVVDAWLVAADGSIKTCEEEAKTVNDCNITLTVNGPVITDKLYLYRTAGSRSGDSSGDPAEVFNLRADTYLWSYAHATRSGSAQTTHTTELPPRF